MNLNRNHAIVCLSVLSAALYFRYVYFAGIVEGIRKSDRKAVNSARDHFRNAYHDRVKTLLDICSDSDMTEDTFNDVCDLMDCPL